MVGPAAFSLWDFAHAIPALDLRQYPVGHSRIFLDSLPSPLNSDDSPLHYLQVSGCPRADTMDALPHIPLAPLILQAAVVWSKLNT